MTFSLHGANIAQYCSKHQETLLMKKFPKSFFIFSSSMYGYLALWWLFGP